MSCLPPLPQYYTSWPFKSRLLFSESVARLQAGICMVPPCWTPVERDSGLWRFGFVQSRRMRRPTALQEMRATYRIQLRWIMQQQGLVCKFLRWLKRWWGNGSHLCALRFMGNCENRIPKRGLYQVRLAFLGEGVGKGMEKAGPCLSSEQGPCTWKPTDEKDPIKPVGSECAWSLYHMCNARATEREGA